MSRRVGRTCLAADDCISPVPENLPAKTVCAVHRKFLGFSVLVIICGLVACHVNDLIKGIIFDCFIKDQIQVIGWYNDCHPTDHEDWQNWYL